MPPLLRPRVTTGFRKRDLCSISRGKWGFSTRDSDSVPTVSLPWTFKWIWGPLVDSIYIEKYGPRRQWIVFAQTGMALTLGSLLLVPDLNGQIDLVARILFVHNIFSSLQDVATDALAVEVLEPDEVARVNLSLIHI